MQELLRDVVLRDVAARHRLRETRHVMNLVLFLLGHTGQPLSFQRLTKNLAIPTVGQTSRYVEFLQDAYLLFSVPRHSDDPLMRGRLVAAARLGSQALGLARSDGDAIRLTPFGYDRYHDLERIVTYSLIEPLWAEMMAEHDETESERVA